MSVVLEITFNSCSSNELSNCSPGREGIAHKYSERAYDFYLQFVTVNLKEFYCQ